MPSGLHSIHCRAWQCSATRKHRHNTRDDKNQMKSAPGPHAGVPARVPADGAQAGGAQALGGAAVLPQGGHGARRHRRHPPQLARPQRRRPPHALARHLRLAGHQHLVQTRSHSAASALGFQNSFLAEHIRVAGHEHLEHGQELRVDAVQWRQTQLKLWAPSLASLHYQLLARQKCTTPACQGHDHGRSLQCFRHAQHKTCMYRRPTLATQAMSAQRTSKPVCSCTAC